MGILGYAEADVDSLQRADGAIAADFDALRTYVDGVMRTTGGVVRVI
jgi:hypothetical protein